MSPKRTPVPKRPGVYSYETRRGTRYVAVAMHGRKQTWLSGFTTPKQADVWREAEVVSMRAGRGGKAPARMTLREFVDKRWWPDVLPGLKSANSVAAYKAQAGNVKRFMGDVRLVALDQQHVQDFKVAMFDDGMGPSAMYSAFVRLRNMLDHAVQLGWINVNPVGRKGSPAKPEHEAPLLTLKQVRRLLELTDDDERYGALFALVVFTGLRWGEVERLQWADIDWAEGRLNIPAGKTRASRKPMWPGERAMERLRRHMTEQMAWAREMGGARPERVFVDSQGRALNHGRFSRDVWHPLRVKLGLAAMHFHDLRHVHAQLLAEAKVTPAVAQRRMRHASIAMTMDVYTDVRSELQREAAKAVEGLLQASGTTQN